MGGDAKLGARRAHGSRGLEAWEAFTDSMGRLEATVRQTEVFAR